MVYLGFVDAKPEQVRQQTIPLREVYHLTRIRRFRRMQIGCYFVNGAPSCPVDCLNDSRVISPRLSAKM